MIQQNCSGCCSLKTGVFIIAILTLINATLSMIGVIVQLALPVQNPIIVDNTIKIYFGQNKHVYAYMIGPCFINLVIALCFIYGVAKEKKYFILPILIIDTIKIVGLSICIIIFAVAVDPSISLLFALVALMVYIWYVIFLFYKRLSIPNAAPADSTMEMGQNNLERQT